jgi:hypothetical protein
MFRLWRSAWGLRLYILAALAVALVVALVASVVISTQRQNQQAALRDTDAQALRAAIVRIAADEAVMQKLVDQNRKVINNNTAQVGTNKLDIDDLRALVAQTKAEVIRQLDGIATAGPPTAVDTVAAKFLAILQRLDRLEARLAALEAAAASPSAKPSPTPTASPHPTPTPTGRPTPSPRPSPEPSPNERCVIRHVGFCSSAKP